MDLEKGENGQHLHFGKGEFIPFEPKEVLGSGRFGEVDRVISLITYKEYARKSISRRLAFDSARRREAVEAFIKEIHILKTLRHQHTVQLIGTYTDSTSFCFIMSPVADMNLSAYLSDTVLSSLAKKATLRTFFGCLSCAVRYLHDNRIRHKDIKPQNILVKGKKLLLADFGISQDYNGTQSTTSGPAPFSPRYCAPEVSLQQSRNYSSDVWSLGCVFLEITAALKSWTVDRLHTYFELEGTQERFIRQNDLGLQTLLVILSNEGSAIDNSPLNWTKEMLKIDRHDRPTAATIAEATMEQTDSGSRFCGMCCLIQEDDDLDSLIGFVDDKHGETPMQPAPFPPADDDVDTDDSAETWDYGETDSNYTGDSYEVIESESQQSVGMKRCRHRVCYTCLCYLFEHAVFSPEFMPPSCCLKSAFTFDMVDCLFSRDFKLRWQIACKITYIKDKEGFMHGEPYIHKSMLQLLCWCRLSDAQWYIFISSMEEGHVFKICSTCKGLRCSLCAWSWPSPVISEWEEDSNLSSELSPMSPSPRGALEDW
ncbi:kinase-like protein [Mytilinidion resinicola]|uniref:non-specific serine/threonine protein kinase n=1 Tax=Mytilinidion resinicola TaxID=574789 RepID=A0A6A6YZB5_9PEZI|nr:kinase-like protein [Mytilinidion resinicola]KAF2814171.1 kinase-like protein [Mytilinidion resinicola]